MNRKTLKLLIAVLLLALIGTALWFLLKPTASLTAAADPKAGERKALYWYDPMLPEKRFDKPGKSPFMDMQLVPKYADEPAAGDAEDDGSLRIDPRVVQNLGVRLAPVTQGPLAREVRSVGLVAVDEHRIEAVQVRAAGWVETLAVRAAGDPVKRGQLLASVYAPELLAAQQEFLLAQKSGDTGLAEAARSRLSLFGLSAGQIARVAKSGVAERRVAFYAPFDGYVMELGLRQGAAVQPGMMLFQLADLSTVWVNAEVPEAQAAWIQHGDAAVAELSALPGERFPGRVDYLYPELTAATRTLKLRVQIDNRRGLLRPGMFAAVMLSGKPVAAALSVPSEALIKTGTRTVVLVAEDLSRFRPVAVRTGVDVGDRTEILEGLSAGQQVVSSGQFLIDSEASLRGALDRLEKPSPSGRGLGEGVSGNDDPSCSGDLPHPCPSPGGRGEQAPDPHEDHKSDEGHAP